MPLSRATYNYFQLFFMMRRRSLSKIIQETPLSQIPKHKMSLSEAGTFRAVEAKITKMNRTLLKTTPLDIPVVNVRTSVEEVSPDIVIVNGKNTILYNYLALPIISYKNKNSAHRIIEEVHREIAAKNIKKSKRCQMDPIGFSPFKTLLIEEKVDLEGKMRKTEDPLVHHHLEKHKDRVAINVDEDTHMTRTTDEKHQRKEKIADDSLECLTFGELNKQLTQYILGELEGKAAKIALQAHAQKDAKRFHITRDQAWNNVKHPCYVPSTHISKMPDSRRRTHPVKVRLIPNIYATNLEYMVHQKERLEQALRIGQLAPIACQN